MICTTYLDWLRRRTRHSWHHREARSIPAHRRIQTHDPSDDTWRRYDTACSTRDTSRQCSHSEVPWSPMDSGTGKPHCWTPWRHWLMSPVASVTSRWRYGGTWPRWGRAGSHTATEESDSLHRRTCPDTCTCNCWLHRYTCRRSNTNCKQMNVTVIHSFTQSSKNHSNSSVKEFNVSTDLSKLELTNN